MKITDLLKKTLKFRGFRNFRRWSHYPYL